MSFTSLRTGHIALVLVALTTCAAALAAEDSAASDQTLTWSVSQPSERLRLPENASVQFVVHVNTKSTDVGSGKAMLHLVQSGLQDANSLYQLDTNDLCLCAADTNCDGAQQCAKQLTLQPVAGTHNPILRVRKSFTTPGTYTGQVSLRLGDQPELQSFKLTVYSSSTRYQWLGAMSIAAGLALYFCLNVWLRRRVAVDDALLPAYRLRDAVDALRERIEKYCVQSNLELPQLTATVDELLRQLTPRALAAQLPLLLASPWAATPGWLDTFKTSLGKLSDKATALTALVSNGVRVAIQVGGRHPAILSEAISAIDALALEIDSAQNVPTQLAPILDELDQNIRAAQSAKATREIATFDAAMAGAYLASSLPPDTQTLQVRLATGATWVWLLVALISLVAGGFVLVLQDFGFGAPADFVKCFFWGLGFSVAGTQLEQLTQTSITSQFGINIPKAAA